MIETRSWTTRKNKDLIRQWDVSTFDHNNNVFYLMFKVWDVPELLLEVFLLDIGMVGLMVLNIASQSGLQVYFSDIC